MQQAYIVSRTVGKAPNRVAVDQPVILGRTRDCAVVVDDVAASRHHMEIFPRSDCFYWRDLNSTNGVSINEEDLKEGELHHGDRIRIGSTVFFFEVVDRDSGAGNDAKEDDADSAVFRETILDSDGKLIGMEGPSESLELLEAVHSVTQEIASNYDPCDLVDRVLETTMRAVHGQRGAMFFAEVGSSELLPCPVCGHVHLIEDGKVTRTSRDAIKVSTSVARRVLRNGESVLIQDTGAEGASSPTESIVSLDLKSIMCVPVRGKYGVLGILYIDTDRPHQQYSRSQMLLTTAVGASAGMAIENANLHQEILDRQRIDQEIQYAGTIQSGFLLNEWPDDDPRFRVCGDMRPAKIVGGDFYDYVRVGPDLVGILIGDVSGKGVPAALAMAQLLAEFRVRAALGASPGEVLSSLNANFVKQSQRGMFCTLLYLTVNLETGEVCSSNAGHHSAFIIRDGKASEYGTADAPPIGILMDVDWTEQRGELVKGDTILMYTDGITEARSLRGASRAETAPDFEEYGVERLGSLVAKGGSGAPADLVQEVFEDVWAHCNPHLPHDDCTLIALRLNE